MICGTSTGAILALAMGVSKMSAVKCIKMYKELSKDVFSSTWGAVGKKSNLLLSGSENSDNVPKYVALLKKYLIYTEKPATNVVALAAERGTSRINPALLRYYKSPENLNGVILEPWQIARASSAAPKYFPSYVVPFDNVRVEYVDGGLVANNPIQFAIMEASTLWPFSDFACVVSIGTGLLENNSPSQQAHGISDIINDLVMAATESELTHQMVSGATYLKNGSYFRLNPPLSKPISLDSYEPAQIDLLIEESNIYIRSKEVQKQLEEIVIRTHLYE